MSVDHITCHILDTSIGKPASNVVCSIYYLSPLVEDKANEQLYELNGNEKPFAMSRTDADGRIKRWVLDPGLNAQKKKDVGISSNGWDQLKPGIYKIKFLTAKYFHELSDKNRTFFPFVEIHFQVDNPPDNHYHIPLLLANHSYTTYRGS